MLLRDSISMLPIEPATSAFFHQVLLTRFNMRVHRPDDFTVADLQRWVNYRTEVFRQVCLPSVVGQVRVPHRWYIGFDGEHPEMVEPLREMVQPYPWIELVPQGLDQSFHTALWQAVRRGMSGNATHLVTTRLDCDDALSLDHIFVAQQYAHGAIARSGSKDIWLAFPHGAQLAEGEYSLYMHNRNSFLTRIVTAEDAKKSRGMSCLQGRHSRILMDGKFVLHPATTTPMWLQYVHGGNVLNEIVPNRLIYRDAEKISAIFGIS